MPTGNIDSRASLELIYPPDAFAQDAARNGQVTNQVALGIRILSAPNAAGNFETERAGQQVGEAVPPTFLAPHRREERLINAGCESPVAQSAQPDPQEGYQAFLADILAAAQRFGFEPEKKPWPRRAASTGLSPVVATCPVFPDVRPILDQISRCEP
jgi:hypothetical protein